MPYNNNYDNNFLNEEIWKSSRCYWCSWPHNYWIPKMVGDDWGSMLSVDTCRKVEFLSLLIYSKEVWKYNDNLFPVYIGCGQLWVHLDQHTTTNTNTTIKKYSERNKPFILVLFKSASTSNWIIRGAGKCHLPMKEKAHHYDRDLLSV